MPLLSQQSGAPAMGRNTIAFQTGAAFSVSLADQFATFPDGAQIGTSWPAVLDDTASGNPLVLFQIVQDQNLAYDGPFMDSLALIEVDVAGRVARDVTERISGLEAGGLAAGSRKFAVGDLNGDGFDDVGFALNREDGRSWDVATQGANWRAQPAVMLSRADGGFDVVRFGDVAYYHSVDIFFEPTLGRSVLALDDGAFWSFDGGAARRLDMAFAETADYHGNHRFGVDAAGSFAIGDIVDPNTLALKGGGLFRRDEDGRFALVDLAPIAFDRVVNWVTGHFTDDDPDANYVTSVTRVLDDGEIAIQAYYEQGAYHDDRVGAHVAIFKGSGFYLGDQTGTRLGIDGIAYPIHEVGRHAQVYDAYIVDGDRLTPVPELGGAAANSDNVNFYEVFDVDGDAAPDLVQYDVMGGVDFFLDTGGGRWIRHHSDALDSLMGDRTARIMTAEDGATRLLVLGPASYARVGEASEEVVIIPLSTPAQPPVTRRVAAATPGDDVLEGGMLADTLNGLAGDDRIHGHGGDDSLRGWSGADRLLGGVGDDRLAGGWGADILFGEEDDDVLWGGGGDDWLRGDDGNDFVFGGTGRDTLIGSAGRDRLQGQGGDDWHAGGAGDDVIRGGPGDDTLVGGDGLDRLSGGSGRDRFEFHASDDSVDYVFDFEDGDSIVVRGTDLSRWGLAHRVSDNGRHSFLDHDGDGAADIVFLNHVGLAADDFAAV
jgi:Ca2+-binding RTX toxin-like protein